MANTYNNDLSSTIANMIEIINLPTSKRKSELRTPLSVLSPMKRRLSSEDSTDSPDKRTKLDSSLDVSWLASPRESKRMRTELLEARNQILNLESRIQHMHGIRKELQVMYDNEIKSYQNEIERERRNIKELEKQVQSVRKREKEVKEELDTVKSQLSKEKLEHENDVDKLEGNISELETQFNMSKTEEADEISKMKSHIESLEGKVESVQREEEMQKGIIKELKTSLENLAAVEREIEKKDKALQAAELKIKDLQFQIDSFGEWEQQAKITQKRLLAYPEMEKELIKLRDDTKRLKEEVHNKLILEEQVYDLNTRLENFRTQEKKLASLQASHTHLENVVEECRLLVKELCEINVPDTLLPKHMRQCVEKLQQQELALTSEKVQLESQLKAYQHDLKLTKLELERNLKQINDLQGTNQQQQTLIHRFSKKVTLLSRERDSYRTQLDSYEKDLTINIASVQAGAQSMVQKERLENMEKVLEGYKEMINDLESELQKIMIDNNIHIPSTVPVRAEQISRMEEEIDKLRSENTRLTERNDELVIRLENEMIGKDQVKGQIVHLKLNPLAEAVAEREANVEKLQAEVDRLKKKILNLEEGVDSSKLGESFCSSRELQSLREQVKSSEIKMQRLKECFKVSSHEFRNVCYMLLGYRIDRVSTNQYRLSNMYAEAPEDYFEFKLNSDGSLNLLETQYSSTLEDMIDLHLRHQSSIPVFLSAVTMDLFNRTTMATKTYVE